MNKRLIILGIVVLLICVGLSGCEEISNPLSGEEDRFVGSWTTGSGISRSSITFFSDGTGSLAGGSTTWMIKDEMLVVYWIEGIALTYNYSFSDNDNILTLIDVSSGLTTVYTKQ